MAVNWDDNKVCVITDAAALSAAFLDNAAMRSVRSFPWFHGTVSGVEASKTVCRDGNTGHGTFLIRQSETFAGGYVLTFNFTGTAKVVLTSLPIITHLYDCSTVYRLYLYTDLIAHQYTANHAEDASA
jgi:hypothetical protein